MRPLSCIALLVLGASLLVSSTSPGVDSLTVKKALIERLGDHFNSTCNILKEKPTPIKKRYTLGNCMTIQFEAYLTLEPPAYYNYTTYLDLNDGVLDESSSHCYNASEIIAVEQIAIKIADCLVLKLYVRDDTDEIARSSRITIEADIVSPDMSGDGYIDVYRSEAKPCHYYQSSQAQEVEVADGGYLTFDSLNFEIHRGIDKPFNQCNN